MPKNNARSRRLVEELEVPLGSAGELIVETLDSEFVELADAIEGLRIELQKFPASANVDVNLVPVRVTDDRSPAEAVHAATAALHALALVIADMFVEKECDRRELRQLRGDITAVRRLLGV